MPEQYPPKYIIPVRRLAFVAYEAEHLVGVEFVDPSNEERVLLSIPGKWIPNLAPAFARLLREHPDVLEWPQEQTSGTTH